MQGLDYFGNIILLRTIAISTLHFSSWPSLDLILQGQGKVENYGEAKVAAY